MFFSSYILHTLSRYNNLRSDPLFTLVLLKLMTIPERETLFLIFLGKRLTLADNINRDALGTLGDLNILKIENETVTLDDKFNSSFITSLKTVKPSDYFISEQNKSISDLNNKIYSEKFNHILSILVNEQQRNDNGGDNNLIKNILIFAKLKDVNITHSGFAFLLKSKKGQLSHFLLSGIDRIVNKDGGVGIQLLLLFFDMGNYGNNCIKVNLDIKNNSKMVSKINSLLELLNLIGAISFGKFSPKKGDLYDHFFMVTPIYYTVFNSEQSVERFLILETGYELCFTDISDYTKGVLLLFSNIKSTLPNLIMCSIDEASINRALSKGITGQQICDYISNRSTKEVNDIVLKQIVIWGKNGDRIFQTSAIIYDHFNSFNEFQLVLSFCQEFMLYCDKERRVIVVKEEDHQKVKFFIKENIKKWTVCVFFFKLKFKISFSKLKTSFYIGFLKKHY